MLLTLTLNTSQLQYFNHWQVRWITLSCFGGTHKDVRYIRQQVNSLFLKLICWKWVMLTRIRLWWLDYWVKASLKHALGCSYYAVVRRQPVNWRDYHGSQGLTGTWEAKSNHLSPLTHHMTDRCQNTVDHSLLCMVLFSHRWVRVPMLCLQRACECQNQAVEQ